MAAASSEVDALCAELAVCLTRAVDPHSPQPDRVAAYQVIEGFKERSPQCLQCGFQMALEQPPFIKHFGLQLIEHFVKYRWNSLREIVRQEARMKFLQLMSNTEAVSEETPGYVKESLARITVEMAKRMWPQKWLTFHEDLLTLSKYGPVQVELVLLVVRRLAEDVHILDSGLSQRRKREMAAALNDCIPQLMAFTLRALESPPSTRVCVVALSAVACLAEWADLKLLLMADTSLLELLYGFLGQEQLKTPACECLLAILTRKSDLSRSAECRGKLMQLMSITAIKGMLVASIEASSKSVVDGSGCVDEEQYVFLKRMCQVLVHLGTSQLAKLWTSAEFQPPDGFELYLTVLLEFSKHGSQLLSLTAVDVWASFLAHNHIKDHPGFKECLPKLLSVARRNLFKLGDPILSDHISSTYNQSDFHGQAEYRQFFSSYRCRFINLLHQLTQQIPRTSAQEALEVLQELAARKTAEECGRSSMLYLEWDGFVSYLECWTSSKTDPALRNIPAVREKSLAVMSRLLQFETADPLLLACQFRCLQSGLVSVLEHSQEVFLLYLHKVFSCMGFLGGAADKTKMRKEVMITRNYITTCFVRLCESHTKLLAPHLEHLYLHYYQPLLKNDVLLSTDKCAFIESFFILSVVQHGSEQQCEFLGELLQEVTTLAVKVERAMSSLPAFIEYLSLDRNASTDPAYSARRRGRMGYVVHSVALVLKRIGSCDTTGKGSSHPSYKHIFPVLCKVNVPLIAMLHELWGQGAKPLLSPYFQGVSSLHQVEREGITGKHLADGRPEQEECGVVQLNLSNMHDQCLQSVSRAFAVYGGQHLYECGFADSVGRACFAGIANLNQWKLRSFIHHIAIPLLKTCTEECFDTVLIPFLFQTCQVTFARLKGSWGAIAQRQAATAAEESDLDDGCEAVSEEVLEEQLCFILSREYAALLASACVKKLAHTKAGKKCSEAVAAADGDVAMDEEVEAVDSVQLDSSSSSKWSLYEVLTPLAERLLQTPPMCELLFLSAFSGLAWKDTQTAKKFILIAGLLYEKAPYGTFSADVYEQLFTQVLVGLQCHGVDEFINRRLSSLALMIYESTVERYPNVRSVLLQVPRATPEKIEAFNGFLRQEDQPLKLKREMFSELISGVVGKHIGEVFKRSVTFDLPEMEFKKKAKENRGVAATDLTALFEDSDDSL